MSSHKYVFKTSFQLHKDDPSRSTQDWYFSSGELGGWYLKRAEDLDHYLHELLKATTIGVFEDACSFLPDEIMFFMDDKLKDVCPPSYIEMADHNILVTGYWMWQHPQIAGEWMHWSSPIYIPDWVGDRGADTSVFTLEEFTYLLHVGKNGIY